MDEEKVTHKITADEILDMVARRKNGESVASIAKDYGLHRNSVTHHLRKYGATRHVESKPKYDGCEPFVIYVPFDLLEFIKTKYGNVSPVIVALLNRLREFERKKT